MKPTRMKEYLQQHKWVLGILILVITLLWGYAWVLMKSALLYMGAYTFSMFRFGVGSSVLILMVIFLKVGLPPKKYWKHIIIVGILQTAIVFLLVMYGLQFVDAGKSSILLYSMPMWSSILAAIFLREKVTLPKFIGLLMGMVGLLTIVGWDIWAGQSGSVIFGEFLILISAISWGLANVYYRLKLAHLPKLQTSAFQMLFGTIGIVIVTLLTEWGEPVTFNAESIFYILFTGIFASALCFTVWFMVLSVVDMVTATISTLLVPIFGLLFSYLILDESFTTGVLIGSLLIILGIIVSQKFSGKKKSF